jgi:hypothetical protein
MSKSETTVETPFAEDILKGAVAIGAYLDQDPRSTFYHLQQGNIPATKLGRVWITTKSRLRKHFNEARFEPLPKEEAAPAPKRKRAV